MIDLRPDGLPTDEGCQNVLRNLESVLTERYPYHANLEVTDITRDPISEVIRIFYTFESGKHNGATSIWCKFRIETSGAITDFEEC